MSRATGLMILSLVVGCGGTSSSSDPFVQATPTAAALAINVPDSAGSSTSSAGESQSALLGDRALFYTITRDVARAVNGTVIGILGLVERITDHPPTAREANKAVWGPITDALSPATYLLVVEKTGPRDYNWAITGKPRGADDSQYRPLLGGKALVVDETHGSGDFAVDFDAIAALDDSARAHGGIAVHYDNTSDPRNVEVAFKSFIDQPGATPNGALYRYAEHPDHAGNLELAAAADIDHDGATLEALAIVSRWNATGAGRSDVVATGGSLADIVVHLEECWSSSFARTYYTDNIAITPTEGDPASCAF